MAVITRSQKRTTRSQARKNSHPLNFRALPTISKPKQPTSKLNRPCHRFSVYNLAALQRELGEIPNPRIYPRFILQWARDSKSDWPALQWNRLSLEASLHPNFPEIQFSEDWKGKKGHLKVGEGWWGSWLWEEIVSATFPYVYHFFYNCVRIRVPQSYPLSISIPSRHYLTSYPTTFIPKTP